MLRFSVLWALGSCRRSALAAHNCSRFIALGLGVPLACGLHPSAAEEGGALVLASMGVLGRGCGGSGMVIELVGLVWFGFGRPGSASTGCPRWTPSLSTPPKLWAWGVADRCFPAAEGGVLVRIGPPTQHLPDQMEVPAAQTPG